MSTRGGRLPRLFLAAAVLAVAVVALLLLREDGKRDRAVPSGAGGAAATAAAEGGGEATVDAPREPLRRVEAKVGRPGATLALWQGPKPLGEAVSGPDGIAALAVAGSGTAELVFLLPQSRARIYLATVELSKASQSLVVPLPPLVDLEVRVLLDGVPGLPKDYQLSFEGLVLDAVTEDRKAGRIDARVAIPRGFGETLRITLTSPIFVGASALVQVPPVGSPIRQSFDLTAGLSLAVRFTGERVPDHPLLRQTELQLLAGDLWITVDSASFTAVKKRKETEYGWLYQGLEPGRHRLRALGSGLVLAEATVGVDGPPAEMTVELPPLVTVAGVVQAPREEELADAWIEVTGAGVDRGSNEWQQERVMVERRTGAFSVRLPRCTALRLTARHPSLAPDPERGHVEVRDALSGAVLRLGPSPSLRFRLRGVAPAALPPVLQVQLFGAGPVLKSNASLEGGSFAVRGIEPGTYRLWFDAPWLDGTGAAPFEREGVVISAGDNDLGELEQPPGARIRFKLLVPEGTHPAVYEVWAIHRGTPAYQRQAASGADGEALITGLGPGRFLLRGTTGSTPLPAVERELALDGTGETVITLDLRR
ncbi:MAG: hypothetical protein ACT4PV_00075 [Planctomycetaceae bacterium]